jgi:hypothetical protein
VGLASWISKRTRSFGDAGISGRSAGSRIAVDEMESDAHATRVT